MKCLISYASKGRENYPEALKRAVKEARKHYKGDFLAYSDELAWQVVEDVTFQEYPAEAPKHKEHPYAFKPHLFKQAFDQGFTKVIWIDSTIVVARDLGNCFEYMKKFGVMAFHNLGHDLNKWISDKAVENIGLNRDENPKQIMACVVGFDIENPTGKAIFNKWLELSKDGSSFLNNPSTFPGFIAHRHDQACLSALLHINKVPLLPYGALIYEAHLNGEFGNKYYFINKAI